MPNRWYRRGLTAYSTGFPGFPNAATTGPAAGGYTSLTDITPPNEITASNYTDYGGVLSNGVVTFEALSLDGEMYIEELDYPVSIIGCEIAMPGDSSTSAIYYKGTEALTVQYCTIYNTGTSGIEYCINTGGGQTMTGGLTVDHCNLYGWNDAINVGAPMTITNNYIHDPVYSIGSHVDGILCQSAPSGATTITGNTILNSMPQTSCIALYDQTSTDYADVTIENNLMGGGGYVMYLGTPSGYTSTNMVVQGNYFTTRYFPAIGNFGLASSPPGWGSNGNTWQDNYYYDGPNAGQAVAAP